jgi:hypothetical protein
MRVRELDVLFLSYDEPRTEEFWLDLRAKCPWAKRVHGVKGLDRAHKEAARAATTDHFITIDADCIVDPGFFEITVDDALLTGRTIVSWPGRNHVNGLVYGNGSIKCWPRAQVLAMRTHESADPDERSVAFSYGTDWSRAEALLRIDEVVPFAEVFDNGSPLHAFRTGFREGVRLALVDGRAPLRYGRIHELVPRTLHWLLIWLSVGADADNGLWCIYGARLGCSRVSFEDWDYTAINDFDWFDRYWSEQIAPRFAGGDDVCPRTGYRWNRTALVDGCAALGAELRTRAGLAVADLDAAQSAFLKSIYEPPQPLNSLDRMGTTFRRGVGVARDLARAADYHAIAAAAGQTNAMNSLARAYHTGAGRSRNDARAVELWREANALGNPFAAYALGELYRAGWGWGISKDAAGARALFRLASDRGYRAAHAKLADMYLAGEGGPADRRRALFHLTLAGFDDPALRQRAATLRAELDVASSAGSA